MENNVSDAGGTPAKFRSSCCSRRPVALLADTRTILKMFFQKSAEGGNKVFLRGLCPVAFMERYLACSLSSPK